MAKQTPTTARRPAASAARGSAVGRRPATTVKRRSTVGSNVTFGFPLRRQNAIGIGAGILVIVIGYILMGTAITDDVANNNGIWNNANAVTIAPILLTLGYCVIIPYFLFKRFDRNEEERGIND